MSAPAAPTPAWSRYWAGGASHSCADGRDGSYSGAIGAYWRQAFADLPDSAVMLDIACGNGALARLLLAARPRSKIRCDAVDLAAIIPTWASGQTRLRFHAGVAAEDLPFADASFDLVASQYGIEYSELDRALAQAWRVCRPGGQIRLAMHHVDSLPCRLAREELGHLDELLLAPKGWLTAARAMIEPMAWMGSVDGQARLQQEGARLAVIRSRFDDATAALHARGSASACPDVLADAHNAAVQAFQAAHRGGAAAGEAALEQLARLLDDTRIRLRDMTGHALDDARLGALAAGWRQRGAQVALTPLQDSGTTMAVALSATLPG